MKFIAESKVNQFVGHIDGRIAHRLNAARDQLERRLRRKFSRDARPGTSRPGTYPKKLRGYIADNIRVEAMYGSSGTRRTGLRAYIDNPRGRMKHGMLESGYTITPKRAKALAVPVSLLARKMASNGLGPRKFPHKLLMKKVKLPKSRGPVAVLYTPASEASKRIRGNKSGTIHYVLTKGAVVRPRRNLGEAMQAEFRWLGAFLTQGTDTFHQQDILPRDSY